MTSRFITPATIISEAFTFAASTGAADSMAAGAVAADTAETVDGKS